MKMKAIIKYTVVLLLSFSVFDVNATNTDIAHIETMVAHPRLLCGNFVEQKKINGVSKTLKSTGRFCVDASKGILWRTITPFANTMRISKNEIVQYRGNTVTMRIDDRKEPMIKVINSLIFSMISGDFSSLQQYFYVDAHASSSTWQAHLTAKQNATARVAKQVWISGGRYINQLTMVSDAGDKTTIIFSGVKTGKSALTAADAAMYD